MKRIKVWVQEFKDRPTLVLQWHDPVTGKRKSRSAGTADPKLAEEKRADLESDLNHGRHREGSDLGWEEFRELFEDEYLAHRRRSTRLSYDAVLNHFQEICRPGRISGITARTISRFHAELRQLPGRKSKEGFAASTIHQDLTQLKTVLRWAAKQKLLLEVPEFPQVRVPKRRPQPVPEELFERLAAAAPDPIWGTFWLAAWLAGLRVSEAFQLRWEETQDRPYLDLVRRRIIIPADFAKSSEDQWVPIDPKLQAALDSLERKGSRVFPLVGTSGRVIGSPGAAGNYTLKLCRKLGLRMSMHALRRGFGCRYAARVPAQVLQKLMRHRRIQTTLDYYVNVDVAVEDAVFGNSSRNTTPTVQGKEAGM